MGGCGKHLVMIHCAGQELCLPTGERGGKHQPAPLIYQVAARASIYVSSPKRSRQICQQRFWLRIARHLPESDFLRYHIYANEAAGAGYSTIRAENTER